VAGFKPELVFISDNAKFGCADVHYAFRRPFQIVGLHCPLGPVAAIRSGNQSAATQFAAPIFPSSVAGEGVLGPGGPRTGNSSGARPGNSSGGGDSPGSRMGGGTSGRGLPGGLSCGGSDGVPGLIGGSSCGSIGIYSPTMRSSPRSGRLLMIGIAKPTFFVRSMTSEAPTGPVRRGSLGTGSAGRRVAHRFDVVTVGIEHERAVIARMIMLTDARRAVVAPACF